MPEKKPKIKKEPNVQIILPVRKSQSRPKAIKKPKIFEEILRQQDGRSRIKRSITEELIKIRKGEAAGKVLDDLKVIRYCCRKTLLTAIDLVDDIMKFKK